MIKTSFFNPVPQIPQSVSLFEGEGFVKSVVMEKDSIILQMEDTEDGNKIFERLASANEFDQENISIQKISDTAISLPLEKKSITFLHGCRCFSDSVYTKFLNAYASAMINRENETLFLDDELENISINSESSKI